MKLIRRGNGVYYIYYDRRNIKSLKTKDRETAKALFGMEKEAEKKGKLLAFERKKTIRLMEFKDLYFAGTETIPNRRLGVEPRTLHNDETAFQRFVDFCGDLPLRQVKRHTIDGFKERALTKGLSETYLNILMRCLRAAFNAALDEGFIEENPFLKKRNKPPVLFTMDETIPRFLFEEEMEALFKAITDPDFLVAVKIYLYSGLRRAELVRLHAQDVDLRNNVIYVRKTKTHRDRIVPICAELRPILDGFLTFDIGPLFPRWTSPDTLSRLFHQYAAAARVNHTLKDLRHTFGSYLRMKGADLDIIRKLMGHTDIKTTLIYAKVKDDTLKAAVDKLSFGGKS